MSITSAQTIICTLNSQRNFKKTTTHEQFYKLTEACTLLNVQEIGQHGKTFTNGSREVFQNLEPRIEREHHVRSTHAVTNRIGTYVTEKAAPYVNDVTPRRYKEDFHHNCTWSELTDATGGRPLFVANLYAANLTSSEYPGGITQLKENWNSLMLECQQFLQRGPIVISTDANARTCVESDGRTEQRMNADTSDVDANGLCLLDLCTSLNLRIMGNGTFTRYDHMGRRPSTIDYFLVSEEIYHKCALSNHDINTTDLQLSDHRLLRLAIDRSTPLVIPRQRRTLCQERKSVEDQLLRLREYMLSEQTKITPRTEGMAPTEIYELFKEAVRQCPKCYEDLKSEGLSFYDEELLSARREWEGARKAWRKCSQPTNEATLLLYMIDKRREYKLLRRRKEAQHNVGRRLLYRNLMDCGDHTTLRELINAPSPKDNRLQNLPIMETALQRSNIRAHIRALFGMDYPQGSPKTYHYLEEPYHIELPSDDEILMVIEGLKKQTSTGADRISPRMWILFHELAPGQVNDMIRKVWEQPDTMPEDWNIYTMSLLAKSVGAQTDPGCIRTISMSQIIVKIISVLMTNRLTKSATAKGLIPDEQFGFVEGRGTADAYFVLRTHLYTDIAQGGRPIITFVDFEKAFDRVNRSKLLRILKDAQIEPDLIRLIEKLYANPVTKVNGLGDDSFELNTGVLQGDPLSPILFAIYLSALAKTVDGKTEGTLVLLFADDVAIVTRTQALMVIALERLGGFCDDNDMVVNVPKTKVLRLGNPVNPPLTPIAYRGHDLAEVTEFKYLGYILSHDLSSTSMAKQILIAARMQCAKIKRWFTDVRSYAPFTLVKDIVFALMRNRVAHILPFITHQEAVRLDMIETNLWRYLLKLERHHPTVAIWSELHMVPPSVQRKSAMNCMGSQLEGHDPNTLIGNACASDLKLPRAASWLKSLSEVPGDASSKHAIRLAFKNQYHTECDSELRLHAAYRDGRSCPKVKACYLADWHVEQRNPFWASDLPLADISLLWRFRSSCTGLGHNDPYHNDGDRYCHMCSENRLETEEHVLLRCSRYNVARVCATALAPVLLKKQDESDSQQMIRITKTKEWGQLAAAIHVMYKARNEALTPQTRIFF